MNYQFDDAEAVLRRTPSVLDAMLRDLPGVWTSAAEGPGTWTPFDVVGHLIHADRTNWIPRARHLLAQGEVAPFPPFDREAMFSASRGKEIGELLDTFHDVRRQSLGHLEALRLTDADLARTGRHPEFGVVTLGQLLSTWAVHDFTHLSQIVRVMAHQYEDAVGPWRAYLSVLRRGR